MADDHTTTGIDRAEVARSMDPTPGIDPANVAGSIDPNQSNTLQMTPPCPRCGSLHRRLLQQQGRNSSWWRCRTCDNRKDRDRYARQRSTARPAAGRSTCSTCGAKRLHGRGGGCRSCQRIRRIAAGERRLRDRDPAYAEAVLAILAEPARSQLLYRIHNIRPHLWSLPRPSELFKTIRLDDRLIHDKRHTDIDLCRHLARVPAGDQAAFYDRYLADPMLALRWAALPRWARPIMAGDADDKLIWGLFTMVRMRIDGHAKGYRADARGLARSLVQEIGFWDSIKDHRRAQEVLSTYGSMLAHGEDVGDVETKPWDRARGDAGDATVRNISRPT